MDIQTVYSTNIQSTAQIYSLQHKYKSTAQIHRQPTAQADSLQHNIQTVYSTNIQSTAQIYSLQHKCTVYSTNINLQHKYTDSLQHKQTVYSTNIQAVYSTNIHSTAQTYRQSKAQVYRQPTAQIYKQSTAQIYSLQHKYTVYSTNIQSKAQIYSLKHKYTVYSTNIQTVYSTNTCESVHAICLRSNTTNSVTIQSE